ncbi:hypothetical protein P6144_20230, partial [Sphingomonas sp. HITSZ_GF]|uniref:hypothetical protein n=1 Tax=Sphingomonas sp. HITSZ_GF TaxID=3037247 RepID=UPI00240E18F9
DAPFLWEEPRISSDARSRLRTLAGSMSPASDAPFLWEEQRISSDALQKAKRAPQLPGRPSGTGSGVESKPVQG